MHTAFFDFFAVGPDGEGVSSSSRSSSAPKTEEKKPNVFAPWAGGRYKKKINVFFVALSFFAHLPEWRQVGFRV